MQQNVADIRKGVCRYLRADSSGYYFFTTDFALCRLNRVECIINTQSINGQEP